MDNPSQNSKRVLPNTSRVSDKIMEYYIKFGQDRNLEKFMRVYSPAGSQGSQNTESDKSAPILDSSRKQTKSQVATSSSWSCQNMAILSNRPLSVCGGVNSKSLPNIDEQGRPISETEHSPDNYVVVDLNIEAKTEKKKALCLSAENLNTPQNTLKTGKPKTPESLAKTHRRLEWDSLGDIGYKKSRSTSNLSAVERSLLKEFFKESSVVSEPSPSPPKQEQLTHKGRKLKDVEIGHGTPPLASSTLVLKGVGGAKPKMISQSTSSTSLNEKFEKYAQTSSITKPISRSQGVQCSMSSTNSVIGSTTTPSSFEYYSSKSSDFLGNTNTQKQFTSLEHPFIANINELLTKRKALGEKNQQTRHQLNSMPEFKTKLEAVLNVNKENQSHSTVESSKVTSFSLSKQSAELDLGIQLICQLIDTKSISSKKKRKLIRDIVKRITGLEAEDQTTSSSTKNSSGGATTDANDFRQQHIYDSVRSHINNKNKQAVMTKPKTTSKIGISPVREQVNKDDNSSKSTTSTSDNFKVTKKPHCNFTSKSLQFPEPQDIQQYQDKNDCKQFPYKKSVNENFQKENNPKVPNIATATINKQTQSEDLIMTKGKAKKTATKLKSDSDTKYLKTSTYLKAGHFAQHSTTSTNYSSTTTTTMTTTPDLTTQKFTFSTNNEKSNPNTDTEQPTMQEWLNPLTQSEIEYEEKKKMEMKKKAAAKQEKLIKKTKHNYGRTQQINWIENEIKRLKSLKHLLVKDECITNSTTCLSSVENSMSRELTKDSTQTDKLYDTVYSDKSAIISDSNEELVHEIEIILEESHEDVVNLKDNTKRTKNRKKETQIIYEKEQDLFKENVAKTIPKLRLTNEKITVQEEQLLNGKTSEVKSNNQRQQRKKIDTPSTEYQESESLRDMVRQRKQEFLKAYKSKKHQSYEALKQKSKEDFKYLHLQRELSNKPLTTTTTSDSEHYSVPHTLPRKYATNDVSYYTQQPLPLIPSREEREANLKTYNPQCEHVIYSKTSATGQPRSDKLIYTTTANVNNTRTTSSCSMFCISSDVSVPMGSQNTSSTPTTTHQYDDVAAVASVPGVAVQTSDSISRSKPIYGPKPSLRSSVAYANNTLTTTACIQVKPKGIAYVIEFDLNKPTMRSSTSDSDTNTMRSDIKSRHSSTTEVTNNLKPILPTEPQLTLQEYLEKNKPNFLQHSKERKAILNQLQAMRQERDRQLREIIDNTSFNSLDKRLRYLPPPPIQKLRILSSKEKRALTNKRVVSLPEVLAKNEREIEEKKRRGNRILKDIFNKRMQKRVRSGKLTLNQSKNII